MNILNAKRAISVGSAIAHYLALPSLMVMVITGLAQTVLAQDVASETQVSAAEADNTLNRLSFRQWVNDFEMQFAPIGRPDPSTGRTFYKAKAIVRVPTNHPGYSKELVLAYEKAMIDLQANFILQNYATLTTKRISEIMSNDSENARQFDDKNSGNAALLKSTGNKVDIDKLLSSADANLDKYLVQQGESTDKVSRLSVPQKKLLFRNNLTRESVKRAIQNMRGLVPVQTRLFNSSTSNGDRTEIGIIAVQSEKTRQFAEDIRMQRPSVVNGQGKVIDEYLPKTDAELLNEFGFRFVYDENGHPMLISYGRWGVASENPNPTRHLMNVENAQKTAQSLAEAWIAEFTSTRLQVMDARTQGSVMEEIATRITHFENSEKIGTEDAIEEIGNTIDKSLRSVKTDAAASLKGTSEIKVWEEKDQAGQLHVGSIITWTATQLANSQNIERNGGAAGSNNGPAVNDTRGSRVVNSKDDF